jgi:L-rhamnose-H+ transport protein
MPEEKKKEAIKEFNFWKGIGVATFSGIMSASFAYALAAAEPIAVISAKHGTTTLWTGLPKLCVLLLGGFTANFIWCVLLNIKNKTGYQYFCSKIRDASPKREDETIIETAVDAPSEEVVERMPDAKANAVERAPMLNNYFFSALAGTTWYLQFFFYTMGETQMGDYKFSSWTLHMASIIIFSSLWGIALKEWKGSSGGTKSKLAVGLLMLILSTVIVGYGNYLGAQPGAH